MSELSWEAGQFSSAQRAMEPIRADEPGVCPERVPASLPTRCIHEVFDFWARRTPDACALIFKNEQLTYGELNRRANQLAHKLFAGGTGAGEAVGIRAERSLETVIGLLAILKSGKICVPLDPEFPAERIEFMIRDVEVRCVLAADPKTSGWSKLGVELVDYRCDSRNGASGGAHLPSFSPDELAYVIFTSGSTGKPKGVELRHGAIVRFLTAADYASLDESKTLLQLASLTFDGSILDLWGALLNGAKCVLYPGRLPLVGALREILREHQVTTAWLTSSLFNTIVDQDATVFRGLEELIVGGEALSVPHVVRAWDALPGTRIINGYGPTETTVFACTYALPGRPAEDASSIPIGRPVVDTSVHILNEDLKPVADGQTGELCIGGPRVARGYRNRAELTAEKFIPDPFSSSPRARLYRTGDRARKLPDGNIEFLGRTDHQVKIHGYRIEMGEIEAVLRSHPSVRDAAVVLRQQARGEKSLVAFYALRAGRSLSKAEILDYLRERLPSFMLPGNVAALEAFPQTSSGKLDRQALTNLANELRFATGGVTPHTGVEQRLARIWEELLDLRPIGVRDDFFAMGGDSLSAVSLLAAIEREFGKALNIEDLLAGPTVEQLANLIVQQDRDTRMAYAVPIQPQGSGSAFFCVGAGLFLRPLSEALGQSRPFYGVGLEPDGLAHLAPPYTVEQIATYLVAAILERQPTGPFYLGGFCHDGLFAYEIAAQLKARGLTVGRLALIETVNPTAKVGQRFAKGLRRLGLKIGRRVNAISRHRAEPISFNSQKNAEELADLVRRTIWRAAGQRDLRKKKFKTSVMDRVLYLAAICYKPAPLDCPAILFRARDWPIAAAGDEYLGWREFLTGPTDTCEVPGDHFGILSSENVGFLAERLQESIRSGAAL